MEATDAPAALVGLSRPQRKLLRFLRRLELASTGGVKAGGARARHLRARIVALEAKAAAAATTAPQRDVTVCHAHGPVLPVPSPCGAGLPCGLAPHVVWDAPLSPTTLRARLRAAKRTAARAQQRLDATPPSDPSYEGLARAVADRQAHVAAIKAELTAALHPAAARGPAAATQTRGDP